MSLDIQQIPWGEHEGQPVSLFVLGHPQGARVAITNYGGIISELWVPDGQGHLADIVLGHDNLNDYIHNNGSSLGALIGRYANRIGHGTFPLDGKTCTIPRETKHALHGGLSGFSAKVYHAENVEKEGAVGLRLTRTSPDGEEGFPGALELRVTYWWTAENSLDIEYEATSNRLTVLNLTNHSYFNLCGLDQGAVTNHVLELASESYVATDEEQIPTGELKKVAGTPLDFRQARPLGGRIDEAHPDLLIAGGYDHCYVLDSKGADPVFAARVSELSTGRVMEVHTTEPGVQLYTANHLDGTLKGKNGCAYDFRDAFCLEAQHYPNSVNIPEFPSTELRPGEVYRQVTSHRFSICD